ncbi:hypothetical protein J4E93_005668 [Alternaria ventricosa]|uniref:uncharacterized protein n=1 Tax=Alternaria ventricosa TaxID=1187951 RepID=UPI0020C3F10A|nr:uncharacterized protein J4E93_005668 [Alternaria ventricosa]KAI4646089.1 hypothetical protein J4E93_005668 [Alternaria ventricosa]
MSHLIDDTNQYMILDQLDIPLRSPFVPGLVPSSGERARKRDIGNYTRVKTEAPSNRSASDNASQVQRPAAKDQLTALAEIILFPRTCEIDQQYQVLAMAEMFVNVGVVKADLEGNIRRSSFLWGEDVPGKEYMTTWMYVDILDDGPLVTPDLIENMFYLMIYDESCYATRGETRGGRLRAVHARTGNELANVVINAVDSRDA